jgi:mRNA interferase MazF
MERYKRGEVVLIQFPFSNMRAVKRRPALVLLDTGDEDLVVARITSQMTHTAFDAPIAQWRAAGLFQPSIVRLHKVATLARRLIARRLGRLDPVDAKAVWARARAAWRF